MIADRDWHTRAIVRVLEDSSAGAIDPPGTRIFRAGGEYEMLQWGWAGREIRRDSWWDSYDIDGAHIIKAEQVEVVRVLEEISPQKE